MPGPLLTLRGPPVKPSVALSLHREAVRAAAARFRSTNPRVFGSALSGADEEGSDLDLLVDPLPGARCSTSARFRSSSRTYSACRLIFSPGDLPPKLRAKVLAEARPV